MMKLSIVIPVYNEVRTIETVLSRVQSVVLGLEKEIIVVDDGSTDGTRELLERLHKKENIKILFHRSNQGKGAALKTGFQETTGDIIVIQDADLEYDPAEYPQLIAPIIEGKADVVFGSRFLGSAHRALFFWHSLGNNVLTALTNLVCDINLTDMETGYKVFHKRVLDTLSLQSNRFGFDPEFTVKVAKKKFRIYEVPVTYNRRNYNEGKKITWRDGITATAAILWFRFFD